MKIHFFLLNYKTLGYNKSRSDTMYKKRKRLAKRNIFIISGLILCLIIGFITNVMVTNRNLTVFEKAIKDSVWMVGKTVQYPFHYVGRKINENKEKKNMFAEYQNLKKQLEETSSLEVKNQELEKQLRELQELLDINNILSDYIYTNATVINRNLEYWQDTIIIDKGEHDGITIDMPVVVKEGLIGKVVQTTTFTSTVRLLTANNVSDRISVKINNNEEYAYGILSKYNNKQHTYTIEGISQNIDIQKESLVTTTGMGDLFPAGIVIGKVSGITTDNFDLAKVLEVKTDVDFNNLTYVSVLKRNEKK